MKRNSWKCRSLFLATPISEKMRNIITYSIICIGILALPFLAHFIWESLPYSLRMNSLTIRNVVNIAGGGAIGLIYARKKLKVYTLPLLLIFLIGTNIYWQIDRFNETRSDMLSGKIEYPKLLPECEKESNYANLWDYMENGCHYSTEDFLKTLLNRVLIFTTAFLTVRIFHGIITNRKRKVDSPDIIDQI